MYLTTAPLSWAKCWTRPAVCQLPTSTLMVTAPSTAAVRNGTAIKAASRHRTRQLLRANRDLVERGGRGWEVPAAPTADGGSPWGWATTADCGPVPCSPV